VHDDVPVSSANLKANEQGWALTDPSNIIGGPPDMVCPYYFFGFLILDVRSGVFRLANGACQMSDDLAILQVRKDGAKVYSTLGWSEIERIARSAFSTEVDANAAAIRCRADAAATW
jgi:hypothetical protein